MIHLAAVMICGWAVLLVDWTIQRARWLLDAYRSWKRRAPAAECEHCGGVMAGDAYRCEYCCGEVDFDRTSHPSEMCICAAKEKP